MAQQIGPSWTGTTGPAAHRFRLDPVTGLCSRTGCALPSTAPVHLDQPGRSRFVVHAVLAVYLLAVLVLVRACFMGFDPVLLAAAWVAATAGLLGGWFLGAASTVARSITEQRRARR